MSVRLFLIDLSRNDAMMEFLRRLFICIYWFDATAKYKVREEIMKNKEKKPLL